MRSVGNAVRSKEIQRLSRAVHLVGQGDKAAFLDVFLVGGQAAQGAWHGDAVAWSGFDTARGQVFVVSAVVIDDLAARHDFQYAGCQARYKLTVVRHKEPRSEEPRVGKAWCSTGRSRWAPGTEKKK